MRQLRLADGEIAIVGYGSLFSAQSIGRTLGREYDGPFLIAHLGGWRRSWNVAMPNTSFYYEEGTGTRVYPDRIVYLNVRREPNASMNCVVFVVQKDEARAMDDREWIYDRVVVNDALRDLKVTGGDAVMYVGREEFIVTSPSSPNQAAIRASYLSILDSAFERLPARVREEYDASTDPFPRELVIEDRIDPDRPNSWAAAGRRHTPEGTRASPSR